MQRAVAAAAGVLLLAGCSMQATHPRGLSEEENAVFVRVTQDQEWEWAVLEGYDQPTITPELVSVDEYDDAVADCLAATEFADSYRFSAEYGGLYFTKSPDDPSDGERLALYVCMSSYQVPAKYRGYYSTDELGYIYDYYRDSLIPCLVNHGYPVPLAPHRDQFMATPGTLDWHPYFQMPTNFPQDRFGELQLACPYLPPGLF
jgi:hypothetical protein